MRTRQQQRILHESFQALLKMVKNHMDISPTKHLTSHIHDRPTHIRQCEGFLRPRGQTQWCFGTVHSAAATHHSTVQVEQALRAYNTTCLPAK